MRVVAEELIAGTKRHWREGRDYIGTRRPTAGANLGYD
jgi:hypothetical protein